ncbi:glycosyltransferase family 4 protein [Gammaproteobacteria bacterium]|nr:glycosyltransferase family 4 protein [Gammaproteobacteria bacterium]
MKICIIVDDYLPNSKKVAGKMMHELATEFTLNGHEVTVITPCSKIKSQYKISSLDSVRICRFKSGKIKNTSMVKRVINESLLSFRAWRVCKVFFKENKHDLIIYYSPSIFWGQLVRKLKKMWGVKSYLILRDFYPQMFFDEGLISKYSPIATYFRFIEWLCYLPADIIAIESPKNLSWFESRTWVNKPLKLLYNWAADDSVENSSKFRNEMGLQDKVVFFYGGNIGPQQDMLNIVRLAKSLQYEKRAHFVIVGEGFALNMLKNSLNNENLKNVTLLPPVPQDEFKKMLSEFDVGLFSLNKEHTTHNIPGKLLGYMVQGKPILGSINVNNDIKDIVEDSGAGLIAINGNDDSFLINALKLLNNTNLRNEMGNNSKILLKNIFSVEAAARTILEDEELF